MKSLATVAPIPLVIILMAGTATPAVAADLRMGDVVIHRGEKYVVADLQKCGGGSVYIQGTGSNSWYAQCASTSDLTAVAPATSPTIGAPTPAATKPRPDPAATKPPGGVSQQWLYGKWSLTYLGATQNWTDARGKGWQTQEMAARGGFVQINPNGTFVWSERVSDKPKDYIRGRWRPATAKEMERYQGAGIVLLSGESGWDWIAMKSPNPYYEGERIEIFDLGTRNLRRPARRMK